MSTNKTVRDRITALKKHETLIRGKNLFTKGLLTFIPVWKISSEAQLS